MGLTAGRKQRRKLPGTVLDRQFLRAPPANRYKAHAVAA